MSFLQNIYFAVGSSAWVGWEIRTNLETLNLAQRLGLSRMPLRTLTPPPRFPPGALRPSPSKRNHNNERPERYADGRTIQLNSPRRLCLWNTKKDHSICEVNFLTAVLSVKLNRKRVAVCLKTALHVFDISDMKCLRTLETASNPDGVMALSPNEENCHLAFPDGVKAGGAGGGGEVRSGFRLPGVSGWRCWCVRRGRGFDKMRFTYVRLCYPA